MKGLMSHVLRVLNEKNIERKKKYEIIQFGWTLPEIWDHVI